MTCSFWGRVPIARIQPGTLGRRLHQPARIALQRPRLDCSRMSLYLADLVVQPRAVPSHPSFPAGQVGSRLNGQHCQSSPRLLYVKTWDARTEVGNILIPLITMHQSVSYCSIPCSGWTSDGVWQGNKHTACLFPKWPSQTRPRHPDAAMHSQCTRNACTHPRRADWWTLLSGMQLQWPR